MICQEWNCAVSEIRGSDVVADAGNGHFGESQRFGLGLLAAGSLNDHVQQVAAQLLQRFGSVDEGRGVEVDVVLHLGKGQLVAGDLDDGDNGVAGGSALARPAPLTKMPVSSGNWASLSRVRR